MALTISVLFIFPNVLYVFSNNENLLNQIIDVQMNVTGIKSIYEIGEQITFSVQVKSLGKIVPWPYYRIYQNYVDVSSDPVYSKMYMTPIDHEDKQNSIAWREKTWDFPLHSDDSIRFFNEGNYTLRVDTNTKKYTLIHFHVVNSTNEFDIIDDFKETFDGAEPEEIGEPQPKPEPEQEDASMYKPELVDYVITNFDAYYSIDEVVTFEFTETGYGDPCVPIKIVYYRDRVWMENIVLVDKIIRDCPVGNGDEFLSSTFDTAKDTEFVKSGDYVNFPISGEYFIEISNENQSDGKVVASFKVVENEN